MKVETDLGHIHLVLDTGATCNLFSSHLLEEKECETTRHNIPYMHLEKFVIGERSFEKQGAYFVDFDEENHCCRIRWCHWHGFL